MKNLKKCFAIDYSGSTSGESFYHDNVKKILDQKYKDNDDIIIWESGAKYISYEDIQKNIPKEYLLEVLIDNKSYDNLYGSKIINFDNCLVKILLEIIGNEAFNIKDKKFSRKEYSNLVDILLELIISYYSDIAK